MTQFALEVRRIITEVLGVSAGDVIDAAVLKNDLRADSYDMIEIAMDIERKYDMSIPDEEIERFKTVGDIISYVEKAKA